MGATSSKSQPGSSQPGGGPPRPAWTIDDGAALPPIQAFGTPVADGADSDSDVEYDVRSLAAPALAKRAAMDEEVSELDELDPASRPGGANDPSMPSWAAGGAADEPCSSSLQLQFVYGVRSTDCRSNAYFTASGEVAFHAASLIVLYEPRRQGQK